jgi:hypothetical protein
MTETIKDTLVLQVRGGQRNDSPMLKKKKKVPPRDVVPMEGEDMWKKSATLQEDAIVTNISSNS